MTSFLKELFSLHGRISRAQYFSTAVLLVVLKYFIDATIAHSFGQPWPVTNYVLPPRDLTLFGLGAVAPRLYAILWAIAIPFFFAGISLTLRRLHDAGHRAGWIFFFFLPILNLLLFLFLSLAPTAARSEQEFAEQHDADLDSVDTAPASAFMTRFGPVLGVALASGLGLLFVLFSADVLAQYAWGLFLGVPFITGFIASWFLNAEKLRSRSVTMQVSAAIPLLIGFLLLGFRMEGLICMFMALPLTVPFAIAGGLTARSCLAGNREQARRPNLYTCVAILPVVLLAEHAAAPNPPVRPVITSVIIDAPVDVVWQNVIAFPPLATPQEWLFKTGIAYPIGATITALPGEALGVGAIRRCRFSTGDFIEPITVWNPNHLLAFNVTAQPPALHEIGIGPVRTPHIDLNYMRSQHGQFRLVALDAHHTLLEGTTWYQDYFWPQMYWRPLSDAIVHRIHGRVLEHVKRESELAAR